MLGRQVGANVLRLPFYARLPLRPASFQCQHDLTARVLLSSSQRYYATPGRPRSTVGEPSRPVKRAVKRAAKAPDGPAKEKVQERKKDAAAKKKAPAKKTAVALKKTTPVAAKKKTAAPKKTTTAPTKKRATRRVLTDAQKATKAQKAENDKIKEYKKAALSPPKNGSRRTAYNMFAQEKLKGQDLKTTGEKVTDVVKRLAPEFKQLSAAELEVCPLLERVLCTYDLG